MCLATVYNKAQEPDSVILQYVSKLEVDGENITMIDVMGEQKTIRGSIRSVDLTGGCVVINCEE